jgi:site-specific recombinase XerD
MGDIKVVLKKDQRKDGTYPLALRITKDRASVFVLLGHSIFKTDWDEIHQKVKKSHPNSVRLNNLIRTRLAEANNKALEMETQKSDSSHQTIKRGLSAMRSGTFFKQADIYLDSLKKSGKFNRYSPDKPRIERFKEFLGGSDIAFSEINPALIKRFGAYLKGAKDITDRTMVNHFVVIRTVFNQAIAANVADQKHYPFGKGKVVIKFPESVKIGLNSEEVKVLEDLTLAPGSAADHARNVWLTSFYFAGMRVSDVLRLKWSDFQNDRLYYSMGKNDKAGSLKVPAKALGIMKKYHRSAPLHDLVFPDLESVEDMDKAFKVQQVIAYKLRLINQALQDVAKEAKLSKKLTMHIARHTFGNISGDKIPIQMLQKLYRHTSITTTIGYQANFIHKDADEALDAVIGP